MKKATLIVVILLAHATAFAQHDLMKGDAPRYRIRLVTVNDNVLKGLLLEVRDSSLLVYPGKRKEWKNKMLYNPVEFTYTKIKQAAIRKRNGGWKRLPVSTGLSATVFARIFIINII